MRRWKIILALALTCGLLAVPGTAGAHGVPWDDDAYGPGCTITAAEYLPLAWQSNQFEIESGQLAQQRAESTAVRDLGAMLVQDHSALQGQITTVAGTLGVTLPTTLDPTQQAYVSQLSALSGAAFDHVWLKIQWRVHKVALALNLRAAVCGDVPPVQTLGQGALPIITHHLAELRALLLARPQGGKGGHGQCGRSHHGHGHGHGRGHAYGHAKNACFDRHRSDR
jgi:putative membrane protein